MPQACHAPTMPAAPLATAASPFTPTRRGIGAATLAALCGGAFGAAVVLPDPGEAFPALVASPDAELIRLCAECDALQDQIDAMYAVRDEHLSHAETLALEKARDIAQEPFMDAQDPLLHRICETRATTPQGHAARARTLLAWDKDPCWTHDGCWNSQLIGAIVRDLVGAA
jgi:hypothetical protein